MDPGNQFPDAAANSNEWRYGLQKNKGESAAWHRQRIGRPSSRAWRSHNNDHQDTYQTNCIFCRQESANTP